MYFYFSREGMISENGNNNKGLFENATPYMISRPSHEGRLFMSARQWSKFIFKLTYIHVQIFTSEYYDKSVSHSWAPFLKSKWIWWQIWMTLVPNTQRLWQIHMNILTNLKYIGDKSIWRWLQINMNCLSYTFHISLDQNIVTSCWEISYS